MLSVALSLLACAPPILDEDSAATLPADLTEGWNEIDPGGDTLCARGTEYSFFVRSGTVNKVVVDFIGGGACWDEQTCGLSGAIFADDMDWMRDLVDADEFAGVYDADNPENPFADWYHVIVPYCTGDIHWGDSVTTYGEGDDEITIHHKGAVNSRAVMGWIEENFSAPEQVLSTGCSAGSYGSIMWSAELARLFPETDLIQIGDSGAGVVTENWFATSFPSWNAEQAFPSWIPSLDPAQNELQGLVLPDLYERLAEHHSDLRFAQFNTILDWNQAFYYEAMGGEDGADGWSQRMVDHVTRLEGTPNYRNFVGPGDEHCIIPYDSFYEVEADGVRLVDWMRDRVDGVEVDNVWCEGCR